MRWVVTSLSRTRHFGPSKWLPSPGIQTTKCFLKWLYLIWQGSLISSWRRRKNNQFQQQHTGVKALAQSEFNSFSYQKWLQSWSHTPPGVPPSSYGQPTCECGLTNMALGNWEPGVQNYHICTFKQLSKMFLSGFFFFSGRGVQIRRVGCKDCQCCADSCWYSILSCASENVGNVQLRTELWIYADEREYGSTSFYLVKGLICVNKYKNLLYAQLQNSVIYSRFSNIYFIIAYVQQTGFQE